MTLVRWNPCGVSWRSCPIDLTVSLLARMSVNQTAGK